VSNASSSLVSNQNMITKIYFPRLILPISTVLSGLVDFGIAFLILLGMMVYYQTPLTWRVLLLPVFILLAITTSVAVGIWLAAFNVRFRDVKYVTPFLMQFWQYATPIAYAISLIPLSWQPLYSLNPMAGVVNGFRWAMLGQTFDLGIPFLVSLIVVFVLLITGLMYFQHMERTFADMV
jgi:lipopolysaccharide transport system permease protein